MNALVAQTAPPINRKALREFYENNNVKTKKPKRNINSAGSLGESIEHNPLVTRFARACRHFSKRLKVFIL
jgi:hypothetical protein